MIKATGRTGDGDTLLILGLSRTNTERLLAGKPIKVNGLDVGLPGIQVILLGGETEEAITAELQGLITKDTLHTDLGGPDGPV